MPITPVRVRGTPEWDALDQPILPRLRDVHLRDLFAEDPRPGRGDDRRGGRPRPRLLEKPAHPETVGLLVALAERAGLRERIEAMFSGEHINVTEDRAVLHVGPACA